MLFASIFTNYDLLPFRLRSHRISGILSTRIEQIQVQGLHCKRKNWIDGRRTVAQQSRTVEWMGCYGITRHDKLAGKSINVRTSIHCVQIKTHPRSTKSLKRLIRLVYEGCRRINYMPIDRIAMRTILLRANVRLLSGSTAHKISTDVMAVCTLCIE
jgi:hypothetical protein